MSSAFRRIRPSFGEGSGSASNPSQPRPESTASASEQGRPRGEPTDASNANASASSSSKRRRVPESVTRNACVNCKKARAKCDGKEPCKRCATRVEASECVYEVHIKHAKEELVKQIKDLKAKDHLTDQILQCLSTDDKVPEILERLKNGDEYDTIVKWLDRAPRSDVETLSPRESPRSAYASDHDMAGVASGWTHVTSDKAVLDHLFQLYFAWVHPVHTLFSERHFVQSYRENGNHCSTVLVNAICAMACHLHAAEDGHAVDFDRLGDAFRDAVRSDIDAADSKLTTIQAFAVLYLVQCAQGHALRASSYLRIATNLLPGAAYQDGDGFAESWRDTVRGVRNLNIEWAQATFQVPQTVDPALHKNESLEDKETRRDDDNWYCYRYLADDSHVLPGWPSLMATSNREKSKLTAIVQDISTMMYTQRGPPISAKQFLHHYRRLEEWREDLPSIVGDVEKTTGVLPPHVLSLLILHATTVVQLLRPLLDFKGFPSTFIEDKLWTYAQQGLSLLDHFYRGRYTCRYQPVLQMFAALQLADTIARFFPGGAGADSKNGRQAIQFGLEMLMQSKSGFPVADPLQELLRRSATNLTIQLPANVAELMTQPGTTPQHYRLDDFIDACTMPTYVQPVHEVHAKYAPSFSAEWLVECPKYGFHESTIGARSRTPSAEERGAQSLMQIRNLLNTT